MRIVAGKLKGHALHGPSGTSIRPTSDRLRETIFNILEHAYGDPVPGAGILDLFAGTGALGIEALSRGASHALFVDNGAAACAVLQDNIGGLGLQGMARVLRRDARRLGRPDAPYSLAFLDPPYGKGLAEPALAAMLDGGWLTPGSLIIVEEAAKSTLALPAGLHGREIRRYGGTQILIASLPPH